jgi:hypothetical protein
VSPRAACRARVVSRLGPSGVARLPIIRVGLSVSTVWTATITLKPEIPLDVSWFEPDVPTLGPILQGSGWPIEPSP